MSYTHLLIWWSLDLHHIVTPCSTQTLTIQKTCKTEAVTLEFWNWDLRCLEMWLEFYQRVCGRTCSSREDADLNPGFGTVNPRPYIVFDILIHQKFILVLHKGNTKIQKKRFGRNTADLSPQKQIVKRWYLSKGGHMIVPLLRLNLSVTQSHAKLASHFPDVVWVYIWII